jgi:hypothetical protein
MGHLTLLHIIDVVQNWFVFVLVVGMLGLVIILIIYNKKSNEKARDKTTQWAIENGLQLLEFESRSGPGPFGGVWVSRGLAYYQFVVRDKQGATQAGWARYDITPFSAWEPEIRWVEKPEE